MNNSSLPALSYSLLFLLSIYIPALCYNPRSIEKVIFDTDAEAVSLIMLASTIPTNYKNLRELNRVAQQVCSKWIVAKSIAESQLGHSLCTESTTSFSGDDFSLSFGCKVALEPEQLHGRPLLRFASYLEYRARQNCGQCIRLRSVHELNSSLITTKWTWVWVSASFLFKRSLLLTAGQTIHSATVTLGSKLFGFRDLLALLIFLWASQMSTVKTVYAHVVVRSANFACTMDSLWGGEGPTNFL